VYTHTHTQRSLVPVSSASVVDVLGYTAVCVCGVVSLARAITLLHSYSAPVDAFLFINTHVGVPGYTGAATTT